MLTKLPLLAWYQTCDSVDYCAGQITIEGVSCSAWPSTYERRRCVYGSQPGHKLWVAANVLIVDRHELVANHRFRKLNGIFGYDEVTGVCARRSGA